MCALNKITHDSKTSHAHATSSSITVFLVDIKMSSVQPVFDHGLLHLLLILSVSCTLVILFADQLRDVLHYTPEKEHKSLRETELKLLMKICDLS